MIKTLSENPELQARIVGDIYKVRIYNHTFVDGGNQTCDLSVNDEWEILYPEIDTNQALKEIFENGETVESLVSKNRLRKDNDEEIDRFLSKKEYQGKWRVLG